MNKMPRTFKFDNFARLCLFTSLIFAPFSLNAVASAPTPRVKPEPIHTSTLMNKKNADHLRKGLRAAQRRDWGNLENHIRRIDNPTAKKILLWRQAVYDPSVSFETLTKIYHEARDWPRMVRIRSKAEIHLFDNTPLSPHQTINWFRGEDPVSGEGRAALAKAYYKTGEPELGDQWLRVAWRDSRLSRDRQKRTFKDYKTRLSPEDHAARADHLIWLGSRYFSMAQALLPHMPSTERKIADARMHVAQNRSGMDRVINAIPKAKQDDAGLLYERARWRRTRKTEIYALPVFLNIKTPPYSEQGKKKIWREKKLMILWAIKDGRYNDAYKLSLNHGFNRGVEFAEAENFAGWIALTKLDKPALAAQHFASLAGGVSMPVSKARALYWQGRSAEKSGDPSSFVYYAQAAKYPNVYYAQLAAEKISNGLAYTSLPPENTEVLSLPLMEYVELFNALRMIGEVQDEHTYNQFSFHLDDLIQSQQELSRLSVLAKAYGYMKPSVRAAKQASRLDSMLTESGYPTPAVITNLPEHMDIPFILSIARQESEFNARAASHANAYGLMQMINGTAKATAKRAKLPYRKSWLTSNPEYAANLGAVHLHDLLEEYNGSYILTAVAYNAGPHRVKRWLKTYGDPRTGAIDPVDWVESIPYSETRNYVQRVMENMQVYRARLNNNQSRLQLTRDLSRGTVR